KELSEEQKQILSQKDHLQHKDRAEVLFYNKCFGNKYELTKDFRDVAKLSKRVEKPVLHLSLRLAPGETLSRDQLAEIGRECAKEFGVAENQYLCVLHRDTNEQHIHIAANRVGFNGKAASDSNNYKRMAALCRRLEKQYKLKEVLSPRAFLSPQERLLPRQDMRKEKLKMDIRAILRNVCYYSDFEHRMQALGYKVIKGRGISFIDDKKVKIKGSEVGFSLAKIEKILSIKQELEARNAEQKIYETSLLDSAARHRSHTLTQRMLQQIQQTTRMEHSPIIPVIKELTSLLESLLQVEYTSNYLPYELTEEAVRQRRKRQQSRNKGIRH
ncbi:relaxase/mobilization nuclease domain-containing protein, partial [Chitinophaga sp.]|uniref:relaxase/mobilization nuclease domain-containing protein n=1 Tax=Chitinophaga sp. TaxID=1869181 RepID=UPI002F925C62